ncbi:MAG: DnaA/Hda family protein [Planctomycetota bacterium]|nr:DnaA/Hda family protein [Planctomycetota bacterium]
MNLGTAPPTVTRGISEQLADRIGHHTYEMWFGHSSTLQVQGNRVEVAANTQFIADWIDSHFLGDLHGVAREALGEGARVEVRVAPKRFRGNGRESSDGAGGGCKETVAANGSASGLSPRPTGRRGPRRNTGLRRLDDFVVGQSNELAFAAARRIAEDRTSTSADGGSPLFIHGECGVGKTHLLQGISLRYSEQFKCPDEITVRYITAEQFTNEYINAVRTNTIDKFRKRTRKLDLLAIDDVHFLSNKIATQNEFQHTLDAIGLAGARLVLASDEHPHCLGFKRALSSRFVSGMVVKIERPDRTVRIKLVEQLSSARGLRVSDAAIQAIAARCAGSVRELEGAVNRLAALRLVSDWPENAQIGLVMVEQLFKNRCWRPNAPLRIGTIVDVVCARLAVNRADLIGSGRHRRVVVARGVVAYLGRELTTMSYPEIAQALGRRHHSTFHTAVKRIIKQLREQHTVNLAGNGESLTLNELVDQLRHEILRASGKPK